MHRTAPGAFAAFAWSAPTAAPYLWPNQASAPDWPPAWPAAGAREQIHLSWCKNTPYPSQRKETPLPQQRRRASASLPTLRRRALVSALPGGRGWWGGPVRPPACGTRARRFGVRFQVVMKPLKPRGSGASKRFANDGCRARHGATPALFFSGLCGHLYWHDIQQQA